MAAINLQDHVIKGIPDLGFYIPDFITVQREKYLLHEIGKISKIKWQQLSNRRLLNFGTQSDLAKVSEEMTIIIIIKKTVVITCW